MKKIYKCNEELVGEKFKNSVVIKYLGKDKYDKEIYELLCNCGRIYTAPKYSLIKGFKNNCGCLNSINDINYLEKYFNTWTSNMAYISGFLLADGCITNNCITISLKRDEENLKILNFIKNELKLENKIIERDYICSLNNKRVFQYMLTFNLVKIIRKNITNDLYLLGIRKNKTFSDFIPNIPNEYFGSWLRGLFDGNGSITRDKRRRSLLYNISSGNKKFLQNLKTEIIKYIPNIKIDIFTNKFRTNSYSLHVSRNEDITRLAYLMYNNSKIQLDRKMIIFKSVDLYSENKTLEETIKLLNLQHRIRV